MKVLLLSDPASIHTVKWVNGLAGKGLTIHLFGMGKRNPLIADEVVQHIVDIAPSRANVFNKLKYFTAVPSLLKIYRQVRPDIVHAHFATSYGLLGRFLKHKPYVVSLWGTDVFEFPKKSPLHRRALQYVLNAADFVLSTSAAMKLESEQYTDRPVFVTPFGVDLAVFNPGQAKEQTENEADVFGFGIVKALETAYGIEVLIKAYANVRSETSRKTKLTIVGGGSQRDALQKLVRDLDLQDHVDFTGPVPHKEVIRYHRDFDVEVFPSLVNESFGVSVVEAMACGTPVIVSDVGGFKEVVGQGRCGWIVQKDSVADLADAMRQMMENESLRKDYVSKGLQRVYEEYSWDENVKLMISYYYQLINSKA